MGKPIEKDAPVLYAIGVLIGTFAYSSYEEKISVTVNQHRAIPTEDPWAVKKTA